MGFFGGSSVDLTSPGPIGSTTPNTGAFTTLSFAPPANTSGLTSTSYSVTGSNSTNLVSLSGTWNTTGAPRALLVNMTNTASNFDARLIDLQVGGSSRFYVAVGGGVRISSGYLELPVGAYNDAGSNIVCGITNGFLSMSNISGVRWASGTNWLASHDLILVRDGAAGTLAQRNSTNAQTFRLYNTFTDASNYERGFFRWNTNVLEIGAEAAGTGTQRQLRFALGTVTVSTPLSITQTWNSSGVTFSGFVVNFTDTASSNSSLVFDFQKNGASLFKMDKFGTFTSGSWIFSSTNSTFGDWNAAYGWSSGSQLTHNSSNRNLRLVFGGSATMLEFGGATSSFPALKRSSAILQIRLADDTGYTTLDAQLRLQGTAPATAGATGTAGDVRYDSDYIYICTAANTWKRVAIATW